MQSVAQRIRSLGEAVDSATLLCVVGFAVMGFIGGVLNASLYARVAEYCGIAREVATLFSGALFFGVFLVASRKPVLLDRRLLTVGALGCAITAAFVLEFALSLGNGLLTIVGFLFSNVASVWASVMLLCTLASLRSMEAVLVAVVCGTALGEVVRVVHPPVLFQVGVVEVVACHALVIMLLYRRGGLRLDEVARGASPASLELSNPESFLQPAHALFLCAALFSVATGYGLTLNEVSHAPVGVEVSAFVLIGVAVWMLLSGGEGKEDLLFSFSVLLVVAGFIIAPFTFLTGLPSANALLRIGVRCFDMLVWLVVLSVGRRNLLALLPTYALIRCMNAVGTDIGAVAGHTTNDLVGTNGDAAMLIAETVLFAFVAFLWLGFRKFSFTDTIRGVVGMGASADCARVRNELSENESVPQGEREDAPMGVAVAPSIEDRCRFIGAECGLTERETEIFAMLARGRNGQFVMDHYVVSRNTVKSHVKHIYAKLGVHSQQELIDLVEDWRAPAARP